MAIRQVRGVPQRKRGQGGECFTAADMREFIRKGMDASVIEFEGHSTASTLKSVKRFIETHQEHARGFRAGVRDNKVYVWRAEP